MSINEEKPILPGFTAEICDRLEKSPKSSSTGRDSLQSDIGIMKTASVAKDFLNTKGIAHTSFLGAMAELVDNARDANAVNLHINTDLNNDGIIEVLDDGCGMSYDEALNIVTIGLSHKSLQDAKVGCHGIGLKTGAMRIAEDFMVFTKKHGQYTCIFVSKAFMRTYRLEKIVIAAPAFNADGTEFVISDDELDRRRFKQDLGVILRFSPYHDLAELMNQFAKIKGTTGTLVVLHKLYRRQTGEFEIEVNKDVIVKGLDPNNAQNESLIEYLRILYLNPEMKIFVNGEKVKTTKILWELSDCRTAKYNSKIMKAAGKMEINAIEDQIARLEEKKKLLNNDMAKSSFKGGSITRNLVTEFGKITRQIAETDNLIKEARKQIREKSKDMKNPVLLDVFIGRNIHRRNLYGLLIYNGGRLISQFEKPICQQGSEFDVGLLGVVGVVDLPYSVLAPGHLKQKVADKEERERLLKQLNTYLIAYAEKTPSIDWRVLGYSSDYPGCHGQESVHYVKTRYNRTGVPIQCTLCRKWRNVSELPDGWLENWPTTWTCNKQPKMICEKKEMRKSYPELKLDTVSDTSPVAKVSKQTKEMQLQQRDAQLRMKEKILLDKENELISRQEREKKERRELKEKQEEILKRQREEQRLRNEKETQRLEELKQREEERRLNDEREKKKRAEEIRQCRERREMLRNEETSSIGESEIMRAESQSSRLNKEPQIRNSRHITKRSVPTSITRNDSPPKKLTPTSTRLPVQKSLQSSSRLSAETKVSCSSRGHSNTPSTSSDNMEQELQFWKQRAQEAESRLYSTQQELATINNYVSKIESNMVDFITWALSGQVSVEHPQDAMMEFFALSNAFREENKMNADSVESSEGTESTFMSVPS